MMITYITTVIRCPEQQKRNKRKVYATGILKPLECSLGSSVRLHLESLGADH